MFKAILIFLFMLGAGLNYLAGSKLLVMDERTGFVNLAVALIAYVMALAFMVTGPSDWNRFSQCVVTADTEKE